MRSSENRNRYSLALAWTDVIPVLLLGTAWIILTVRGAGFCAVAGMGMLVVGGLSKAVWKIQLAVRGKETEILNQIFRILMPAGGILSLVAAVPWCRCAPWKILLTRPSRILLACFLMGMILMGIWSRVLDDSRKSTWIKELTNLIAQGSLLWYVIIY